MSSEVSIHSEPREEGKKEERLEPQNTLVYNRSHLFKKNKGKEFTESIKIPAKAVVSDPPSMDEKLNTHENNEIILEFKEPDNIYTEHQEIEERNKHENIGELKDSIVEQISGIKMEEINEENLDAKSPKELNILAEHLIKQNNFKEMLGITLLDKVYDPEKEMQQIGEIIGDLRHNTKVQNDTWHEIYKEELDFYTELENMLLEWITNRTKQIQKRRKTIIDYQKDQNSKITTLEETHNTLKNEDICTGKSKSRINRLKMDVKSFFTKQMEENSGMVKTRKQNQKKRKILTERFKGLVLSEEKISFNLTFTGIQGNIHTLHLIRSRMRENIRRARENIEKNKRIFTTHINKNDILFYHLLNKNGRIMKIAGNWKGVPTGSQCIEMSNKIFVCGGIREFPHYLSNTWCVKEIDQTNGELETEPYMMVAKAYHSLISIGKGEIYSVGGENDNGSLGVVERYSMRDGEWDYMPRLNQKKHSIGVVPVDYRYIYAFGGQNAQYFYSTVELLDTHNLHLSWTLITTKYSHYFKPTMPTSGVQLPQYIHSVQPTRRLILLFGGSFGGHLHIFDLDDDSFHTLDQRIPFTQKHENFSRQQPKILADTLYIFGGIRRRQIYTCQLANYDFDWKILRLTDEDLH